jgi:23S rRNA pseudouridine955/2504/2580 synthase
VQVLLVTGRTHQIRVHASYQGHPVAGDNKYGDKDFNRMARKYGLRRIFLHASRICLPDNYGFKKLEFTAPMPEDLGSVLQELP